MSQKIFLPLFDAIIADQKVSKHIKNRFSFGAPVKALFPYAFAHIIGETLYNTTDDGNIVSGQTRLAIRLVAEAKQTKNDLEKIMAEIAKIIENFRSEHIFWVENDGGGIFFPPDDSVKYTQLEQTFLIKFFV